MLPDGILPIPRIRSEPIIVNKLNNQVTLLEYLLHFVDPDLKNPKGDPAGVHFRVKTHRHLFGNYSQEVLDAIAVRNSLTHPKDAKRTYTEAEKGRAVDFLFHAIREVCAHPNVPRQIAQEVLERDYIPSQQPPSEPSVLEERKPTPGPQPAGPGDLEKGKPSHSASQPKPRRFRKWAFRIIVIVALFYAYANSNVIWNYAKSFTLFLTSSFSQINTKSLLSADSKTFTASSPSSSSNQISAKPSISTDSKASTASSANSSSNQISTKTSIPTDSKASVSSAPASTSSQTTTKTSMPTTSRDSSLYFNKRFQGTIGDSIYFDMHLQKNGGALSGNYKYRGYTTHIKIDGLILNNENYWIKGYDIKDGRHIDTFDGRFVSAKEMRGTWSKPDGTKRLPFYLKEVD